MNRLLLFTAIAALFSCQGNTSNSTETNKTATLNLNGEEIPIYYSDDNEYAEQNESGFYGEDFELGAMKSINQAQTLLAEGAGKADILLTAEVTDVCAKKGCWMTLSDADSDNELMVKFKDYGFFVPRDITGREILIKGFAYMDTTSVEDLRHYAEDAGKTEEEILQITEPKEAMLFEATGAVVL